ncbi:MAG: hypothetical protein KDB53_18755 [Planctomycetes bacterium]|nr:hypothetical protein [Planctomycetota bacterium]
MERPRGQVLEDGRLTDHDWRFTLRKPKSDWLLFDEEGLRWGWPDARGGLFHRSGGHVFVWAETDLASDLDLDDYLGAVFDTAYVASDSHHVLSDWRLGALRGRTLEREGTLDGVEVRVIIRAVEREGCLWTLIGDGVDPSLTLEELGRVMGAFSLLDGPVTPRINEASTTVAAGVGYRMRDGVFEDVPHRFRVRPFKDFFIMGPAEIKEEGGSDRVAWAHPATGARISLSAIVGRPRDMATWVRASGEIQEVPGQVELREPIQTIVDGKKRQALVFRNLIEPRTEHLSITFAQGSVLYDLTTTVFVDDDLAQSTRVVKEALGALEIMSDAEAKALEVEWKSLPDIEVEMMPRQCVRRGRFLDFDKGLRWTKPEGYWDCQLTEPSHDEVFSVSHLDFGTTFKLSIQPDDGETELAVHHARQVAADAEELSYRPSEKTRQLTTKGLGDVYVVTLVSEDDEPNAQTLAVARVGNQRLIVRHHGFLGDIEAGPEALEAFLGGLQLKGEAVPGLRLGLARAKSQRWGFAVGPLPEGFGAFTRVGSKFETTGVSIKSSRGEENVTISASVSTGVSGELRGCLSMFDNVMRSSARIENLFQTSEDTTVTLAGRTCPARRVESDPITIELIAMKDRGLRYLVVIAAMKDQLPTLREAFRLID